MGKFDLSTDVTSRKPTRRSPSIGLLDSLPKGMASPSVRKKMNEFLSKIPAGEVGCTVDYPKAKRRKNVKKRRHDN